ncbi:MAG: hypothetical protein Q4C84_08460 [Bacillota bacterium]|nr:hypothetical protein [Bacillota bacterium]
MKVILLHSKEKEIYEVKKIVNIGYRNVRSFDGEETVSGLFMQGYDEKWFYIPDISKEECNRICEKIFTQMGCLDLRKYGEYFCY